MFGTCGAGFEPFVHEEVEPVVDVEPQVVQLVGGVGGGAGVAVQNRVHSCVGTHDEQLQRGKPEDGVQGIDGAQVYDDCIKGVGVQGQQPDRVGDFMVFFVEFVVEELHVQHAVQGIKPNLSKHDV